MNKILKIVFLGIIIFNFILTSWYVLHNDIQFFSDIARDFLLLEEVDDKKIVLIGPRSSTGLFHGPLWLYVNYPAFLLGNGNPVIVGWNWVLLSMIFVISGYFIAKNLFNKNTAYLFTLMTSVYVVFHTRGLYNPHGAMFLIPAFFFFFIKYLQTQKLTYLLIHVFLAGLIIQFQMAIGFPFAILSFVYILVLTIKNYKPKNSLIKRIKPLLLYLLIPVLLSNFIIFDLRHDHILYKQMLDFVGSSQGGQTFNYLTYAQDRIRMMFTSVEILRWDPGYHNFVMFLIFLVFLFMQIKNNKYRNIYLTFIYFYVGFFILSFINKGALLYFYLFPLFPFVFLIFSSFITSKFSKIFLIIFLIIFYMNMKTAVRDTNVASDYIIGKEEESWKFLHQMAKKVYEGKENEFGYFIYSPDIVGYKPRYVMSYTSKLYNDKTFPFQKKDITYFVLTPPARGNAGMKEDEWKIHKLHINKQPLVIESFDNQYRIEKYSLTPEEQQIPFDPGVDPGLHYR